MGTVMMLGRWWNAGILGIVESWRGPCFERIFMIQPMWVMQCLACSLADSRSPAAMGHKICWHWGAKNTVNLSGSFLRKTGKWWNPKPVWISRYTKTHHGPCVLKGKDWIWQTFMLSKLIATVFFFPIAYWSVPKGREIKFPSRPSLES